MDTQKWNGYERLGTFSYCALETRGASHRDELFSVLLLGSVEDMPREWVEFYRDTPGLGLNHEGPHFEFGEDWDLEDDEDEDDGLDDFGLEDLEGLEEDFDEEGFTLLVPMHFFYN